MKRESPSQESLGLDVEELLDRCMGNLNFAERILALFQSRFDADLEELERAVLAEDCERIRNAAHRIKGAAANTAAHAIRRRAAGIERLAQQQTIAGIPSHLEQLRTEWTRFAESAATLRSSTGTTD